ncbi:MAG: hypothetical protein Kow00127_03520 [Bacteroidales bacterium]
MNKKTGRELYLIAITVLLKFVMMDWLNMRAIYIVAICSAWIAFIYYRQKSDDKALERWGIRRQNFFSALAGLFPFALVSVAGSLIFWRYSGHPLPSWHILMVLVLYLAWGTFQQFILVSLIVLKLLSYGRLTAILTGAILFSLIHTPDPLLMVYTFIMEVWFISVFIKYRNLWSLGVTHGLAGTALLYFVQNRDLWAELLAWFVR